MSRTDLLEDGRTIAAVLTSPARGFDRVVTSPRPLTPILLATAVALLFAAVAVPRLDFAKAADAQLQMTGAGGDMTQHQRDEALEQARKVGTVATWAGSAVSPALSVLVVALVLWLAFKVAGTSPPLKGSVAVAAYALLPHFLSTLLFIPALVARAPVDPAELQRLVPSSLAWFLPAGGSPVLAAVAGSIDLFSLWAVVLLVLGMARLSGASLRRSAITVTLLWLTYVALLKVAPAAAMAAARLAHKGGA
jgi:hypothetical protein